MEVITFYIKPGSPWEKGSVLRDGCLDREIFYSLRDTQGLTGAPQLDPQSILPRRSVSHRRRRWRHSHLLSLSRCSVTNTVGGADPGEGQTSHKLPGEVFQTDTALPHCVIHAYPCRTTLNFELNIAIAICDWPRLAIR